MSSPLPLRMLVEPLVHLVGGDDAVVHGAEPVGRMLPTEPAPSSYRRFTFELTHPARNFVKGAICPSTLAASRAAR